MTRPRITIARAKGWTTILAVNAALIRAYIVQEMFIGGILMIFALQVGLWKLRRARGRARRFWSGFVLGGTAATLALFTCDISPGSGLCRWVSWYAFLALNLAFDTLPNPLADHLDAHQDQLLTVVYFLPELAAALLVGLIAAARARPGSEPKP